MMKRKSKRTQFSNKHTKSPPRQVEEDEIYSESATEPSPKRWQKPSKSPVGRRQEKFRSEYEYSEFEMPHNEYVEYDNGYDHFQNDLWSEAYEGYTTEDSYRHRRRPGRSRMYMTESVSEGYDSDNMSGWGKEEMSEDVDYWEGERRPDTSELASEYSYREDHPRGEREHKYGRRGSRHSPDMTESETSPYRGEYNVYLAHQPIGHRAFRYNREQHKQTHRTKSNDTESSEKSDTESVTQEEETESTTGQQNYAVYAAHVGQNSPAVFQQQQIQGKVLSSTNFNNDIQKTVPGLENLNREPHKDQSEIVYLPVVMVDDGATAGKSKLISPRSLINQSGEPAEKPLETKMQVYVTKDMEQNNIFKQAQQHNIEEAEEAEEVSIYDTSNHQREFQKRKSRHSKMSLRPRKYVSKADLPHNLYPVQKSYINVLSRLKSQERMSKRASGINFLHTLPRVSQKLHLSKSHQTNERTLKKVRQSQSKTRTDKKSSEDAIEPFVDIIPQMSTSQHLHLHTSAINLQDQTANVLAPEQLTRKSGVPVPVQSRTDTRQMSRVISKDIEKEDELRKSLEPLNIDIKPSSSIAHIKEDKKAAIIETKALHPVVGRQSVIGEGINGKQNEIRELRTQPQKILSTKSSKLINRSVSKQNITRPKERKSIISTIFRRNPKQKGMNESRELFSEVFPEHYDSDATLGSPIHSDREKKLKRKRSRDRRRNLKRRGKSVEFLESEEETINYIPAQLFGFYNSFLIIFVQTAQFFLGLTTHDKLIELMSVFQRSDQTRSYGT
uniref:Uncharacterized protein n=1 Tax=Graphocephala atropunctata TaxID=36148 RepID=A0A1B6LSK5_9HEMI